MEYIIMATIRVPIRADSKSEAERLVVESLLKDDYLKRVAEVYIMEVKQP